MRRQRSDRTGAERGVDPDVEETTAQRPKGSGAQRGVDPKVGRRQRSDRTGAERGVDPDVEVTRRRTRLPGSFVETSAALLFLRCALARRATHGTLRRRLLRGLAALLGGRLLLRRLALGRSFSLRGLALDGFLGRLALCRSLLLGRLALRRFLLRCPLLARFPPRGP